MSYSSKYELQVKLCGNSRERGTTSVFFRGSLPRENITCFKSPFVEVRNYLYKAGGEGWGSDDNCAESIVPWREVIGWFMGRKGRGGKSPLRPDEHKRHRRNAREKSIKKKASD